jgi:hypothetical protein
MTNEDLSLLDRGTLRTWRAANLVGWGAAGAGADLLLLAALVVVPARFASAIPSPLEFVLVFVGVAASGLGAGWVVGSHVYRWPALVSGIATATLAVLVALTFVPVGYLGGVAAVLAGAIPNVAAAALAAGYRWRRRPAALRAGIRDSHTE